MSTGALVHLVGGRWDGATLRLPADPPPEVLGLAELEGDRCAPVASATARLLIASGRLAGCLYELEGGCTAGHARYRPAAVTP